MRKIYSKIFLALLTFSIQTSFAADPKADTSVVRDPVRSGLPPSRDLTFFFHNAQGRLGASPLIFYHVKNLINHLRLSSTADLVVYFSGVSDVLQSYPDTRLLREAITLYVKDTVKQGAKTTFFVDSNLGGTSEILLDVIQVLKARKVISSQVRTVAMITPEQAWEHVLAEQQIKTDSVMVIDREAYVTPRSAKIQSQSGVTLKADITLIAPFDERKQIIPLSHGRSILTLFDGGYTEFENACRMIIAAGIRGGLLSSFEVYQVDGFIPSTGRIAVQDLLWLYKAFPDVFPISRYDRFHVHRARYRTWEEFYQNREAYKVVIERQEVSKPLDSDTLFEMVQLSAIKAEQAEKPDSPETARLRGVGQLLEQFSDLIETELDIHRTDPELWKYTVGGMYSDKLEVKSELLRAQVAEIERQRQNARTSQKALAPVRAEQQGIWHFNWSIGWENWTRSWSDLWQGLRQKREMAELEKRLEAEFKSKCIEYGRHDALALYSEVREAGYPVSIALEYVINENTPLPVDTTVDQNFEPFPEDHRRQVDLKIEAAMEVAFLPGKLTADQVNQFKETYPGLYKLRGTYFELVLAKNVMFWTYRQKALQARNSLPKGHLLLDGANIPDSEVRARVDRDLAYEVLELLTGPNEELETLFKMLQQAETTGESELWRPENIDQLRAALTRYAQAAEGKAEIDRAEIERVEAIMRRARAR